MKKVIKKNCDTCYHGDGVSFNMFACLHPQNKKGGSDNWMWSQKNCISKKRKHWKKEGPITKKDLEDYKKRLKELNYNF